MVVKRGGELEPFEAAKLRRCLAAALWACDRDPRLADALARAVELHLQSWNSPHPPSTDYVFRCACVALSETGLAGVARYLVRRQRRRAARRRELTVFDPRRPGRSPVRWRKASVALLLRSRYGLRRPVARFLAGVVERQVFNLGYAVVSTTLIRELIRNELLAWGLADLPCGTSAGAADAGALARGRPDEQCQDS